MQAATLRSPRLSAARVLVLLATMAGLFAMHGLTDHGPTHWGEPMSMSVATPRMTHVEPPAPAIDAAQSSTTRSVMERSIDAGRGRLPTGMGLMGLCLAVLVLAALLVTRVMRASRPVGVARRLPQLRTAPLLAAHPPDRHRLQVHRC